MKETDGKVTEDWKRDALWFMKLAWNLALQCKTDVSCMKEYFTLCAQLLTLCPVNAENHQQTQLCRVMSSTACLEMAREAQDSHTMQALCQEVLQHVEEYKLCERRAINSTLTTESSSDDNPTSNKPNDVLILVFEFEALIRLNDPRAETLLEKAIAMPNPEPKLFHNLAALTVDGLSRNHPLCMRALKTATRLHLQQDKPDLETCSADIRHLIDTAIQVDEADALTYLREILDVIETRLKGDYPETETLWLMTRVWNHGLELYNCGRVSEAETWCSLSMKLLKYVSDPENYHDQMTFVYGEMMAKLDRDREATVDSEE